MGSLGTSPRSGSPRCQCSRFNPGLTTLEPSRILTRCSTRQRLGVGRPRGLFIVGELTAPALARHRRGRVAGLLEGSLLMAPAGPRHPHGSLLLWGSPDVLPGDLVSSRWPWHCPSQKAAWLDRVWDGLGFRCPGWVSWGSRCPAFGGPQHRVVGLCTLITISPVVACLIGQARQEGGG